VKRRREPGHLFKAARTDGTRPGTRRAASWAERRARADELDQLRLQRSLTAEEAAEADRLAHCLYMRLYRQQRLERFGAAR
jgi:hypothetical protein